MVARYSVAGEAVPVHSTGGAIVGELITRSDGTWLEKYNLDPKRHQLHKPPAWATDEAHLAFLREHGARGLRLHTIDGKTWQASLADFEAHGIPLQRGHGCQVALALRYWETTDPASGYQLGLILGDAE